MDLSASLAFANWLLRMATFEYVGLAIAMVLSVVAVFYSRKQQWLIVPALLPVAWIAPLAISGLAVDLSSEGAKSADWTGVVAVCSLILFVGLAGFGLLKAKRYRLLTLSVAILNAPMMLLSAFVVGMAATGDWV